MSGLPRRTLTPLVQKHRLGALISVHRQYIPFVRRKALFAWLMTGTGLLAVINVWVASLQSHTAGGFYEERHTARVIAGFIVVVTLVGAPLIGPLAAWIRTPGPRPRWLLRFEHGLIDARLPTDDELAREPEFNVVGTVYRFDQIRGVVHIRPYTARKRPASTPTVRKAFSFRYRVAGTGRIVADRQGKTTELELVGFRGQDALLDAVEAATAPRIFEQASDEFRRTGVVTFDDLTVTSTGLSAKPPAEAPPPEVLLRHPGMVTAGSLVLTPVDTETPPRPATHRSAVSIRWDRVAEIEVYNGSLVIYRVGRPGEADLLTDGTVEWFDRVVANAAVARAVIRSVWAGELRVQS